MSEQAQRAEWAARRVVRDEERHKALCVQIARFEQLVALFEPLVGAVNKATRTAR